MSKALLMALCLLCATAQAETKVNFSGDAYVRGYFKNSTGPDGTQAFNQFFRLNVDAKPDDNLTIKTGLVLSSETWEGDTHKLVTSTAPGTAIGGTNEDGTGNGNITHLDHAVIEYKKDGWITSVGRHAVTTPGCFLTCDDRRDRVQVLKILKDYSVVAFAYDKRGEGALNNSRDDLDMFSVNYYGLTENFKYALQTGYWVSKKYDANTFVNSAVNLDNIKQVSPQIEGKLLGVDYNFYYTLLFGGSALYKNDHHAFALKLAHDFDIVKIEAQSILTINGGLIAGGFDSLSSIINNNPDHNQSSIKLRTIGFGLGIVKKDESVHMLRFSKNITTDLSVSLGGGYTKILTAVAGTTLEENKIVDATAKYAFSKSLNLAAAYGKFFGDNKDAAGSLTVNANF
jgi:hypothetical protein